jgi:signal transduction histidine kinase
MEERVRRLGGDLRLESHPGRGTLIAAELPLSEFSLNGSNGANHDAPDPHLVG